MTIAGRAARSVIDQLPYIDEHARQIEAPAEQVWRALLATLPTILPRPPSWLAVAWGLQHQALTGHWDETIAVGDTIPGFAAAEIDPSRLLVLRGRHRFSLYELRFELERPAVDVTYLCARTSADFPGVAGRAYRALVIGTRVHRIGVEQILAKVARRAKSGD